MARNTNPLGRTNAKNTEPTSTRVIFRMFREYPITIYPDEIGTAHGIGIHRDYRQCYTSSDGHGDCHLPYIMADHNSRPALPHEYAQMYRELTEGYGLTLHIAEPLPSEVPNRVHQKRMNNYDVTQAWRDGKGAQSNNGNLYTDGLTLYSYAMPIGKTLDGVKVGLKAFGMSATTTNHVQDVYYVAELMVKPVTVTGLWYTAWGALKTKWYEWPE